MKEFINFKWKLHLNEKLAKIWANFILFNVASSEQC